MREGVRGQVGRVWGGHKEEEQGVTVEVTLTNWTPQGERQYWSGHR